MTQRETTKRPSAAPGNDRLLLLAHDGDRAALGALLTSYRTHIVSLARARVDRRLQVKVDASDLAQDACLEAHRHFRQFRGVTDAEFDAWLRKILAGIVANSVRRYAGTRQRDLRREQPFDTSHAESTMAGILVETTRQETPSEIAIENETAQQLQFAMASLPPHYRQVIEMRTVEELSFAEVSNRMRRSVDSVEKLWLRAIGRLKKRLAT